MNITLEQHAGYWGVSVDGKIHATFADESTAAYYADQLQASFHEEEKPSEFDPSHDPSADLADEQNDWRE